MFSDIGGGFFCRYICTNQKNIVPLQRKSRKRVLNVLLSSVENVY